MNVIVEEGAIYITEGDGFTRKTFWFVSWPECLVLCIYFQGNDRYNDKMY